MNALSYLGREHVDKIHRPPVIEVDEPSDEILNIEKDVKVKTVVEHTQTQTKQEENGSEKCKSCGKLFSSVLDLEWHKKTQHEDSCLINKADTQKSKIQCDQCEFSFEEVPNFIAHIQSIHNINQEIIPCKSCDFKTLSKDSLYEHIENEHLTLGRWLQNMVIVRVKAPSHYYDIWKTT